MYLFCIYTSSYQILLLNTIFKKNLSKVKRSEIQDQSAKMDESVIECVVGVPTVPSDSMAAAVTPTH